MAIDWESNEEIEIFREYLRIPSVHPNIDYDPCVEFLQRQAQSLELSCQVYRLFHPKHPIVVISWVGTEPELPSILLNSHMDVVPVYAELWTHPPFAAEIDEQGRIFARGAQDMKSVGMQYLAAIRSLKRSGQRLKRTLHLTFAPDEETDARYGMQPFVHHDVFKALNIGFALDEGLASETDTYQIFYGERCNWKIVFKCSGTSGHGSLLLKQTAGEKLAYIIEKMMTRRRSEMKKMEENPELTLGDLTTINLTMLNGGVQYNVVPPLLTATFDVRLSVNENLEAFEKQLSDWCTEAGGGIAIEYPLKHDTISLTNLNAPEASAYWTAFKCALEDDLKLKYNATVFPANTDISYIRKVNIPAIGFSPMANTPVLLHENDEFLTVDQYLKGIEIYTKILLRVANL